MSVERAALITVALLVLGLVAFYIGLTGGIHLG